MYSYEIIYFTYNVYNVHYNYITKIHYSTIEIIKYNYYKLKGLFRIKKN
jgi:hypothetical protein